MKLFLIGLITSIFLVFNTTAADIYWVNGAGNWSDNANHWSLASGGAPGAAVPAQGDNAIFDDNSGLTSDAIVLSVDVVIEIDTLNFSALSNSFTMDSPVANNHSVFGSIIGNPSGINFTGTWGEIELDAVNPGESVLSGAIIWAQDFRIVGELINLLDDFNLNENDLFVDFSGIKSNGHTLSIGSFFSTTLNLRSLDFENSIINVSDGVWDVDGTDVTENFFNAIINLGNTAGVATFTGGSLVYGDLISLSANTTSYYDDNSFELFQCPTATTLEINNGDNLTTDSLRISGNCTTAFTLNTIGLGAKGSITKSGYPLFQSNNLSITNVDALGGATYDISGSEINNANGWTLSPKGLYWINDSGDWSDTLQWSFISGGDPSGCIPDSTDFVFFDENSFTAANQVVLVDDTAYFKTMDWSGITDPQALVLDSSIFAHGDMILNNNLTINKNVNSSSVRVKDNAQLTTNAASINCDFVVIMTDNQSTFELMDNFITTNAVNILLFNGKLNTQGNTVEMGSLITVNNPFSIDDQREIDFGASEVRLYQELNALGDTVLNIIPGTSNLFIGDDIRTNALLTEGKDFYNVTLDFNSNAAQQRITGNNTFNKLKVLPGSYLYLRDGDTQTINDSLIMQGNCMDSIYISTLDITNFNVSNIDKVGNDILLECLSLTGVNNSGDQLTTYFSTDIRDNTNWDFDASLSVTTSFQPDSTLSSFCFGEVVYFENSSTPFNGTIDDLTFEWTVGDGSLPVEELTSAVEAHTSTQINYPQTTGTSSSALGPITNWTEITDPQGIFEPVAGELNTTPGNEEMNYRFTVGYRLSLINGTGNDAYLVDMDANADSVTYNYLPELRIFKNGSEFGVGSSQFAFPTHTFKEGPLTTGATQVGLTDTVSFTIVAQNLDPADLLTAHMGAKVTSDNFGNLPRWKDGALTTDNDVDVAYRIDIDTIHMRAIPVNPTYKVDSLEHQFETSGDSIIVTLNAMDTRNFCESKDTFYIDITRPRFSLLASNTNKVVCPNTEIEFEAYSPVDGTEFEFIYNGISQNTPSVNDTLFEVYPVYNEDTIGLVAYENGCQSDTMYFYTYELFSVPDYYWSNSSTGNEICAKDTVTFTASSPDSLNSFQYLLNNNSVTAIQDSIGTYTSSSLVNNDIVSLVVIDTNLCRDTTSVTFTVNPLPNTSLSESTGGNVICENDSVTFTAADAATYEFFLNNTSVQGPGTEDVWGSTNIAEGDVISVVGFSPLGCSFKAPEEFSYLVNSAPENTLVSSAEDSTICSDEDVTFSSSGSSVYEFFINGVSAQAPSTNSTFEPALIEDNDIVSVIGTTGGCSGNEPEIQMTVNPAPLTALTNDSGGNEICLGETVTFTASGATNYEFFIDGVSQGVASTENEFITNTLTNGQIVSVIGESNSCTVSASNTFTVLSRPNVDLTSNNADNIICEGESISFTGSNATEYEFFVNNNSAQGPINNSLLEDPTFNIGENDVFVVGVANNGCTDTSDVIGVTVNPIPTITVSSSDIDNTICEGEVVEFTSSGGDTYQFVIDGTPQTSMTSNNSFSTSTLTDGQALTVNGSLSGCSSTSDTIVTNVNPLPNVTLTSSDADNIFCEDDLITFTANGATNYEFFVDGVSQGASSANNTIDSEFFVVGTYPIEVIGESNTCINSSSFDVTVNSTPDITLVSSDLDNSICEGETVTYTASGGVLYEFFINGISEGAPATNNSFSSNTLENNDIVSVEGSTASGCASNAGLGQIEVIPIPTVNLTSSEVDQEICIGETVTFTASGATDYEFFINGLSQGAPSTDNEFIISTLASGDAITVEGTQNGCSNLSNTINFQVFQFPVVNLVNNGDTVLCNDELTDLTSNGAENYLLHINGTASGTMSTNATFNTLLNDGDEVTVLGETNGCESFSNSIAFSVFNYPTITATSSEADLEICLSDTVDFSATGAITNYELAVNSFITQTNATGSFSLTGIQDGDVVSITGYNAHCASAPSDFVFTVNEMTLGLSVTPSNMICEGEAVTFTASGGDEFEFFINDNSNGPLSTTESFSSNALVHHDEITFNAFNTTTGCYQMFNEFIIMNVMETPTITPLSNIEFCEGDSVILTSNIDYGNQWYLNGNPIDNAVDTFVVADTSGSYSLEATMGGNGDLWSIGQNASGLFANGQNFNSATPLKGAPELNLIEISSGFDFVLGINENNDLYAWGKNNSGQLGNGTFTNSNTAISAGGLTNIKTIATSENSSMATNFNGEVYVWGNNNKGQLATGDNAVINFPYLNPNLTDIDSIAAGKEHFILLKNDGTVLAVGANSFGQLGNGSLVQSSNAVQILGLTNIVTIGAGQYSSYAINANGELFVWGNNANGQLGLGDFNNRLVPTVSTIENIVSIQGGANHTVFLNENNEVYTAGGNAHGQLGLGNQNGTSIPKKVNIAGVNMIAAGQYSTLLKRTDLSVFAFGNNTENQISPIEDTVVITPIHIKAVQGVSFIEAGRNSSHFIYGVQNSCIANPIVTEFLPAPDVVVLSNADTLMASQNGSTYQWYFNGNIITGETNQTILATSSGNYSVEVFYANGCSSISEKYYHSIAGVDEVNGVYYKVYPNPTNESFNIELFNNKDSYSVTLIDNLGKKVYSNQFKSAHAQINTSDLANGVYYLIIKNPSFDTVEKIVVNH